MSTERPILKLSRTQRAMLMHLRIHGVLDNVNFPPGPMMGLAAAGYLRINTKIALTHVGKIVADHLLANSR